MAENDKKQPAAVYVSWVTFKNAIDQLASAVLPNVIDRTVFTGMNWSIQNQLFSGLKFLGLIDDSGKPTADLESLVVPDEATRKAKLKEILQHRYADLFSLNLKKTTPGELDKKMGESYGVSRDTKEKATRFFVGAAEYVGVELSSLFDSGKKQNGTSSAPRAKRAIKRTKPPSFEIGQSAPQSPGGTSKTVALRSGGTLTLSATLDIFSLDPLDRKFVFELIDKMEAYEKPVPDNRDVVEQVAAATA